MDERFHIGIDVGGTFTDLVSTGTEGNSSITKVANRGTEPSTDVLKGIDELGQNLGFANGEIYSSIDVIVHGTTVATNAILTNSGAKTGLITTAGFRDALEMRRGIRERLYDNRYSPPDPLVPRFLRHGIGGRISAEGNEVAPLDQTALCESLSVFRENGVRSVAVCFMHSYRNPEHEIVAGEIIRREWPEVHLSLSHVVLPERKFYERVSTTVINAVVGPILEQYLGRLETELIDRGFSGVLRVMKSNGGLMSPDVASHREAAHTLLSGPAGAVAGATGFSKKRDNCDLIVMDMGGTSCDVSLIEKGMPLVTRDGSMARYRLMLPMLDIHTVGAGGGSIASVDKARLLEVGPASAGSHPGPACYGRGGKQATVTDADVILGYISPSYFLGGRMELDWESALRAIEETVAKPLGLTAKESATGIFQLINAKMAAAIREVSVQRGFDPRRFTLLAAGGAASVHSCAVARDVGIRRILIPRNASVFSAVGMLTTDYRHDFVRSYEADLANADSAIITTAFSEMREEAKELLTGEGVIEEEIRNILKMDLRYSGQVHEVELTVEAKDTTKQGFERIRQQFHERHRTIYSYATESDPIEVVNLRLTGIGKSPEVPTTEITLQTGAIGDSERVNRVAFMPELGFLEVDVFDGRTLEPGSAIQGPAIVELPETNIVIDGRSSLSVEEGGDFLVHLED